MFGTGPYDRFGQEYDVPRVLTAQDTFNMTAYEDYSPLYLPAAFAMTYLLAFALSTCVIVHAVLYHGRTLLNGFKRIRLEDDDIHLKLMQNYPEVPDWWYGSVFVFFFCMAIVAAEVCSQVFVLPSNTHTENFTPGLGHGDACLGTSSLCIVTNDLCASIRLYLCNVGSSCRFTLDNKYHPESSYLSVDFAQFACGNCSRDIATWPAPR